MPFHSSFWSNLDLRDGHQIAKRGGYPCLGCQSTLGNVSLKLPPYLQGYQGNESSVQIKLENQLGRKLLRTIVWVRDVPEQALIYDRLAVHQVDEDLYEVLFSRGFH